jgi:hypothetical protein
MRDLIFIHGRSQQGKDSQALKDAWVGALNKGMANAGLTLDTDDKHIHFPYYGDTLIQLIDHSETIASVTIKGGTDNVGDAEAKLIAQVVDEVLAAQVVEEAMAAQGKTREDVFATEIPEEAAVTHKGPLQWGWVLAGLRLLNEVGFGTLALELCTRDVYQYVNDASVRKDIDDGVSPVFNDKDAVVVAHSLGTVIAYSILNAMGGEKGWKVPAFITLGSPLAIRAINQLLPSIGKPSCVSSWYNGRDPKDTVALFPLAPKHFPNLGIVAKNNIDNTSSNHHGIEEYLGDSDVARWIHAELAK